MQDATLSFVGIHIDLVQRGDGIQEQARFGSAASGRGCLWFVGGLDTGGTSSSPGDDPDYQPYRLRSCLGVFLH